MSLSILLAFPSLRISFRSGPHLVSLTVSVVLPTRLQLLDPVWLKTFTVTVPALNPGREPERLVALVG